MIRCGGAGAHPDGARIEAQGKRLEVRGLRQSQRQRQSQRLTPRLRSRLRLRVGKHGFAVNRKGWVWRLRLRGFFFWTIEDFKTVFFGKFRS